MNTRLNTLIELYKVTIEEWHHQERIYVQAFVGLGIIIPVFLAAISFFFSRDSYLRLEYIHLVRWAIFSIAVIIGVFFIVLTLRIDGRFVVCRRVSNEIEEKLRKLHGTPFSLKMDNLLIKAEVNKRRFDKIIGNYRLYVYIVIGLFCLVGFWFFLFRCIDC